MAQTNIVAVLIVRCTHTGVYADGRPNPASVTLYDLDEITIQKNRTRAVPIPAGSGTTRPAVDIARSTRTFVSYHQGDICTNVNLGLITAEIILQLRDKSNCGGPAGTGQSLRPAVLNAERVGDVLRLVIPDNVIPTVLDSVGFMCGEKVTITGFPPGPFRNLDGEYLITDAVPGDGLAGAEPGSYLLEMPSEGADIAAATLAGVNLCLTDGRVVAQFNSGGDVGGFGDNVIGYVGGQFLPGVGGGGGTVAVFDEGILVDAAVSTFDFIGAGVTVTSAGAGAVDVTVPGGGGTVDLQQAYENGNTIVTSSTYGDLDVSGTEAISLDASQASNFTVAGANLSLGTTTSGAVLISSAGLMNLDAVGDLSINSSTGAINVGDDADTGDINIGTGAAARSITLGNSTGATGVTVNVGSGEFALNSTVGEADPVATLTTTGANGDSIELFVGDSDPSGSVTGLAGSLFFRDTGAGAELYLNTSVGSGTTWTQISTGGGAGVTLQQAYQNGNTIVTDATNGDLDVSGTEAISLDASQASNFTVAGANLSLGTTTSGAVLVSSAGILDLDAAGDLSVNSSGGAINIGDDADAGAINIGTGAAARSITIGNSTGATGVDIDTGTGALDVTTTNGEASSIVTLTTTGASGDSAEIFVGDNDPNGSVTGLAGSLFLRDTGSGGELWINTSTGSGTTWTQVSTGAAGGATAILQWGNDSVGNSTASRVLDPGYENRTAPLSAGTAFIELRVPRAGTLRNLYIYHNNPGGTGAVITYTVYVNGVATAISAGLASTAGSAADTTNSVVVAAGDRVRVEVTKVAAAGGGSRRPEVTLEVAA